MRRLLVLAAVLVVLPSAALAATVTRSGNETDYHSDLGETNNVAVTVDGSDDVITEYDSSLSATLGCTQVDLPSGSDKTGEVRCPKAGVTTLRFELGSRNDIMTIGLTPTDAAVSVVGGSGRDEVDYSGSPSDPGVAVSFDNVANDGPAGRGDNIHSTVENARGTQAADVLTGDGDANDLRGAAGNDTLTGARGDDVLTGGRGRDKVFAGKGADTIRVRDGERDTVVCGKGKDKVEADRKDQVSKDCEKVSRR